MPSLHLRGVSFSYTDAVPLLREVHLQLTRGWYGVVGANGIGKTTLLRLMSGGLEPEAGAVSLQPPGSIPVYCAQEVEVMPAEISTFAVADDGAARRLRGQLAVDPSELVRWTTLSPGERKRWQIGAALAASPSLLLLDEPTNHLDSEARELLRRALADFAGIGLLVSHDRTFLDELTEWTLRVHDGRVHCVRGGYSVARSTWEREERERRDEWSRLRDEQQKLDRRLRDRQQKKAQSMAQLRTSKHMHGKSRKDNAARNAFKGTRRRSKDVSLGKDVRKTHKRLDRVAEKLDAFRFRKAIGRSLFVDYVAAPSRILLSLETPALCVGDRVLLEKVSVAVGRESRIRVAGPNGVGKTTLLRALLRASRIPQERLLYLPQELGSDEENALLESVRGLGADLRGRVMALVAALGVDPEPLLASRRSSPGEARKLALAWGLARQVWGLVLDEPTNHLDLPSIERLEETLAGYPGALVVVTHDEALARRCTNTTWELGDRSVAVT